MTVWILAKEFDPSMKTYHVTIHQRSEYFARLFDNGYNSEHDADLVYGTLKRLLMHRQIGPALEAIELKEVE